MLLHVENSPTSSEKALIKPQFGPQSSLNAIFQIQFGPNPF